MTSRTRVLGAALAATVFGVTAALSVPPDAGPTTTSKLPDKPVTKRWPVYDTKGRLTGKATWRATTAGGNCCEVLVATTSSGRIVEFGGTYPAYSDDQGRSWSEIAPAIPSTSRLPNPGPRQIAGGEGTIVMAPGGSIVGVGWDPYSGDRLQSFLYDAATKQWYFLEAPLHEPFYDREWLAVAKGPFTIAGQTVPWVSMVLSNYHRNVVLISLDGLHYVTPTSRDLDALRNTRVDDFLKVARDPEMDYLQPHSETHLVPLAGGGALSFDQAVAGCPVQRIQTDGEWTCFSLPEQDFQGRLIVDSRGWLHEVQAEGDGWIYRVSRDGGSKWATSRVALPGAPSIESWDFKVNGRLGLTALVAHARKGDDSGNHQDFVARVDVRGPVAKHLDTMLVGDGNMSFTSGLDVTTLISGAKSNRVDFATVAILPSGKIVAGFADKTYDDPAVAVQV